MPLDYRQLWANLRIRLQDMAADQAVRAAVDKDMDAVRKHQGAYAFVQNVLAEMESLVTAARQDSGNKPSDDIPDTFS